MAAFAAARTARSFELDAACLRAALAFSPPNLASTRQNDICSPTSDFPGWRPRRRVRQLRHNPRRLPVTVDDCYNFSAGQRNAAPIDLRGSPTLAILARIGDRVAPAVGMERLVRGF
ncbi:MAG: hypothetical protein JNJ88_11815 [Planctomycetes bacterium]|nr:hypothetical protein [Planctomycetota bacterium]